MKKYCNICKVNKELSDFNKDKNRKDGLVSECRSCQRQRYINFQRSEQGLIYIMYKSQIQSCKFRDIPLPNYTKSEFKNWLLTKTNFKKIYRNWVESGYVKELRPSIDRKDDYKTYSFENIQLVTWFENHQKYQKDRIVGKNTKTSRAVLQFDLKGNFIKEYHSLSNAGRELGVDYRGILGCCKGYNKTAYGYKWKYKHNTTLRDRHNL